MCGICLILEQKCIFVPDKDLLLWDKSNLSHRGPDAISHESVWLTSDVHALFTGFTLHFQGDLTRQPLRNSDENLLLWNGEIFGGIQVGGKNDGGVLASWLSDCKDDSDILKVIQSIRGPFAFIYWQKGTKRLWFGRCVFGRRSLLFHVSEDRRRFALSSVALPNLTPWKEVPANGIYCINLEERSDNMFDKIMCYPWISSAIGEHTVSRSGDSCVGHQANSTDACSLAYTARSKEHHSFAHISSSGVDAISANTEFFNTLDSEAGDSWAGIKVCQGGIGLKVPFQPFCESLPTQNGFINSGPGESDTCTRESASSLNSGIQDNADKNKQEETTLNDVKLMEYMTSVHNEMSDRFIECLGRAVQVRIERQSHLCHNCIMKSLAGKQSKGDNVTFTPPKEVHGGAKVFFTEGQNSEKISEGNMPNSSEHSDGSFRVRSGSPELGPISTCGHARVGVLFSGGIDSLVIAALADRFVPEGEPIDLLNVAFEQVKQTQSGSKKASTKERALERSFEVPDRITGRDGLKQLNPSRKWNFIEINITLDELQHAREERVKQLVYPLNTVLDDSIGCAVWFAARGEGLLSTAEGYVPYTTSARVMLVGMGADEQLAGYSRHRVKFKTGGWEAVVAEIRMEIERISARNLGRDDRIISDHAREARFPFLDEEVVSFLNSLPIWIKADLNLPRGIGEKLLLRITAHKLGLEKSSTLPKRAIQFGSRIAKIENKKEKGSDVCQRL